MIAFLLAVLVVALTLLPSIKTAFTSNAALNGLILGVLILGVGYIFRSVFVLTREAAWLRHFRAGTPVSNIPEPRLRRLWHRC